ncbi:hypothetical protein LEP1GSC170_4149 [Leptospira interrogans serovar Bataviae str. HAI135]|nr:hypothetical protein LEP1GSC170_4149 [Leptospira interrogans serovar Bataviae str. HAI135]
MIFLEEMMLSIRRYTTHSVFLLALICTTCIWITLPLSILSESTETQIREKIWQEIYNQDFHSSKRLVQLELAKSGKNETISLLSFLEISLNGLERHKQANDVRKKSYLYGKLSIRKPL